LLGGGFDFGERVTAMTEAEWLTCTDPQKMMEFFRGKASDRKLRLFAVACCRRVWHLLVDKRSLKAVEVAERFADSAATEQELEAVRQGAWEFALHVVHEDERFFDLDADALNAADAPAWAAEWSLDPRRVVVAAQRALGTTEGKAQADLIRCIVGNPCRIVTLNPSWVLWNDGTVAQIAQGIYEDRAFDRLPILADALEDAGCHEADILSHCRQAKEHVRGCWVVDLVRAKK
jgi:hypothetical protein